MSISRASGGTTFSRIPRSVWLSAAALFLLQVIVVLFLGTSYTGTLLSNCSQTLASIVAAATCLRAFRNSHGIARRYWTLLSLAFLSWALANGCWTIYENVLRISVPNPSFVRFLFFIPGGFFAMALFLSEARDSDKLSWSTLLDFFQITIVISFLYFDFYYLHALSSDAYSSAVLDGVIGACEDFLVLFIAAVRFYSTRSSVLRPLYAGSAIFMACYGPLSILADYGETVKNLPTGSWFDFCWTIPMLVGAFWAASWQQPLPDLSAKSQEDYSFSRIATRNLALGLVPLLVAVEALHLPPAWNKVGMATLILSALCYAARLILGEYREARSAVELQQTLTALSASQENYRRFVSQSSEGIFRAECAPALDLSLPAAEQITHCLQHGRIAEANDALARMLGAQKPVDLIDKRFSEWTPQYFPSFPILLEHLVESGFRVSEHEFRLQDANGNQRVLRLSLSGLVENAHLGQAWGILRDVTENVRLEAQLRQTQKMDALGRLAGGVAHDFNNILSVITGYCELSHQQVDPSGPVSKNLNHIKKAADRAVALTRQLLSFCRKQVVFPRAVDLNELVRNSEEMLHRVLGEDISLTFAATTPLGHVHADPGQLEQVLMNLVINARDAMPRGGQILVSTAEAELDAGTSQNQNPIKSGRYVLLVVSDSGVGMTDEVKSHLFEPFFTTKGQGKGTGLGLSTVHGIIQQAGGRIWVYSEPGRGSTFKVYLPRLGQNVAPPFLPEPQVQPAGGSETILLVEDDQAVRKLTASMLRGVGYDVVEAGDANTAVRAFADSRDRINLLLTDVMMPGQSGVELASQLRKAYPALKVLYVSGYSGDRVANPEQFQDGFSFLEKPFTRNSLLSRLRMILDGSVAASHELPAKPAI